MTDQNVLRLRTLGEITEVVPYLVGFTPEESLVAIVSDLGRVMVTARVDLADMTPDDAPESLMRRLSYRYPDATVLLLAYTSNPAMGWGAMGRCTEQLGPERVPIELLINDDTWTNRHGGHGTIDPYGAVAATMVTHHGLQRRGNRAELEADFNSAPPSDTLHRQLQQAVARMPASNDELVAATVNALREEFGHPAALGTADAFRLAVLVHHHDARDVALFSITTDNADRHLHLWQRVIRTVQAEAAQPALFLAGMAAWAIGDGARAAIALERLEPPTPDNHKPVGVMLATMIDQVVPPTEWGRIRTKVLNRSSQTIQTAVASLDPATRMPQQYEQVEPAATQPPDRGSGLQPPNLGPSR